MHLTKKLTSLAVTLGVLSAFVSAPVSAHVAVKPTEVLTAGFQIFSIDVGNEKDQPVTGLKLLIPEGLSDVTPTQKQGWQITVDKVGSGENATVKSIEWTGGAIDVGLRDDFSFSAEVPDKATELQWKAYQTYQDGTVVSWDQPPKAEESDDDSANSGPFSVTKVVTDTTETQSIKSVDQSAADADKAASRAQTIGLVALVISVIAAGAAFRKK